MENKNNSWLYRNTANIITITRVPLAICLFLTKPFSLAFKLLYLLIGIGDAIDGPIAKKLGIESEMGANIEGLADMVYVICVLVVAYPVIMENVSVVSTIFMGICMSLRLLGAFISIGRHGFLLPVHSHLNKFTSFLMFVTFIHFGSNSSRVIGVVFLIALFVASVDELICRILMDEFDPHIISCLNLIKERIDSKKVLKAYISTEKKENNFTTHGFSKTSRSKQLY